MLDMTID